MRFLRSKRFLALIGTLIAAGVVAAIAIPAVTSQSVVVDTTSVHLRTQRTVAEGFDSGWHIHPGLAIVQVQVGTIQIYENGCTPTAVGPGNTFIEVPWLPVRGIATGHVEWTTTFVLNGGDPFQIALSAYAPGLNPCPTLP
jgi:hypothetical protein